MQAGKSQCNNRLLLFPSINDNTSISQYAEPYLNFREPRKWQWSQTVHPISTRSVFRRLSASGSYYHYFCCPKINCRTEGSCPESASIEFGLDLRYKSAFTQKSAGAAGKCVSLYPNVAETILFSTIEKHAAPSVGWICLRLGPVFINLEVSVTRKAACSSHGHVSFPMLRRLLLKLLTNRKTLCISHWTNTSSRHQSI